MKVKKIPTLIGITVLIIGVVAGVFLVQQNQVFRLGATSENSPKNVRMTNVSDDSFSVSWTTDEEVTGLVKWGTSTSAMSNVEFDEIAQNGLTHYTNIRGLNPETDYYFVIVSGEGEYDNNGVPWTVSTGPTIASPTSTKIISGNVLTQTGTPAQNAIVYANMAGTGTLSTVTSKGGAWIIPISLARESNLTAYAKIDDSDVVEIKIQAEEGVASAQATIASANPTPPIILGEFHDFKNSNTPSSGEEPSANINIPESSESSKFRLDNEETETEEVTLESVGEGEVVSTTTPQFFGAAPPETEITIVLESDPVTDSITSSSSGNWSWNPPDNLEEGTHTITVSWRDANGVLNSIKRTFVVLAAEDSPGFEATPSATPTSSPTPTNTPKPSLTPTPTSLPSGTPSATVSATPTNSPVPLPESGIPTPTFLVFVIGLGFLFLGGFSYSLSQKR